MPEIDVNEVSVASETVEEETKEEISNGEKDTLLQPENEEEEEWLDVLGSGHLKIKTLVKGEPETRPQNQDICTIKYEARLDDGTVVDQNDSFQVEVNGSEVIQGLDLVLPLLNVGQKVEAIIKSRFGYGTIGLKPNIPPNCTLTYTIELLKFDIPAELTNVPFEDRIKKALYKKERGNWWYSRGEASKAVQCYRAALDSLQDSTPYVDSSDTPSEMPEEVFREIVQHRLVMYNNLAAAQIMINAYDSALMSVENVIQIEPYNIKALFRKGKILMAKGNTDEAVVVFTQICNIEPENSHVRKELNIALKQQAKENQQAKSLYKKMLNTDGDGKSKNDDNKPAPATTSTWTKVLGLAASVTLAALIAVGVGPKFKSLGFWE